MEENKTKNYNWLRIATIVVAFISAFANLVSFINTFDNGWIFTGSYLCPLVGMVASIVLAISVIQNDKKQVANVGLSLILCQGFFSTIINFQYISLFSDAGDRTLGALGTIINIAMVVIPFVVILMLNKNPKSFTKNTLTALIVAVPVAGLLSSLMINDPGTNTEAHMSIVIGILLCLYLLWYIKYEVEGTDNAVKGQNGNIDYTEADENFLATKTGLHVVLFLFTFGIWLWIWIYRTTRYLNRVENAPKQTPINQLLLCLIPFYFIYWGYKNAQRADMLCREYGMHSDLVLPTILLSIFLPVFAPLPIQSKLNYIVLHGSSTSGNQYYNNQYNNVNNCQQSQPQPQTQQEQQPTDPYEYARAEESIGAAKAFEEKEAPKTSEETSEVDKNLSDIDVIYKYKELLDKGIITAEEFEKKKKEVLGL